jgi:DNA-binding MarR family transcriptional regulator
LSDTRRRPYRDREHTYSLRNSEIHTLTETGKFRVIDVSDLATFSYAGDRARLESDIRNLEKQGLAERHRTSVFKKESREILTLTKHARRLIRKHEFVPKDQAIYHGFVKPKEASHDADLYRLYQKAASEIERKGGKISRVILDYELKETLCRKLGKAQAKNDPNLDTRRIQFARELHLPVVEGKVVLPDMRIEYETQEGSRARVDLELASGHYHANHLAEKAKAGFRIYARPEDAARLRRVRDDREITTAILSL